MKLSIIVPVYNMNHDGNLQFCLDSLVNQTIEDYEIIAVDDASTDDSLCVLNDYEKKYPDKIKVISYFDNRHQGGARNEGLKVAKGDWIGFIDSDDWVTADYYQKLIEKGEQSKADVVGCCYSLVRSHTFEVGEVIRSGLDDAVGILDEAKKKKLILAPGSMVIKVYRRELIFDNDLSFPEKIFYEDNCAAPVWAAYYKHFELVDEPLYYYLQNEFSTVHTITEERCRDRMTSMNLMIEEFKERGMYDTYKDELEKRYFDLYFRITLFSYMIGCKRKKLSFVKELKKGLLERFPDFKANPYYDVPDQEEKKMVDLCMKSTCVFYIYYSILWFYRRKIRHIK